MLYWDVFISRASGLLRFRFRDGRWWSQITNGFCSSASWCVNCLGLSALAVLRRFYHRSCVCGCCDYYKRSYLLSSFGVLSNSSTLMFSDSQSAIQLVHNPKLHRHTTSIDVQFHLNQEAVLSGEVTVTYIPTHAPQPTCLLKLYLQINVFVFAHSLVSMIDSLCSHWVGMVTTQPVTTMLTEA